MLRLLNIRDFVIVDQAEIAFGPGFTVFSGETGAGKSILVDALALALGERGDAGVLREGASRADISAVFDPPPAVARWLAEHDIDADGELVLRRVIDAQGRSRGYINGVPVTLAQLRELGGQLVDIHGQHAHQSLLRADAQRDLLDSHGGHGALRDEMQQAWQAWRQIARKLEAAERDAGTLAAERERLQWQVSELDRLGLKPGEWDALQAEHSRLAHAQSLLEGAAQAIAALDESEDSAHSRVTAAAQRVAQMLRHDASLKTVHDELESARIAIAEAVSDLNAYLSRVELDPDRLAELGKAVTEAMQALAMQGGSFRVELAPAELSAHGAEHIEFQVAGHAGTTPRALAKVASGGELARISLALSVIASRAARVPTLIFDEVDSGVGGAVAEVVGRLLRELGARHQVLCVTHLPQVAACANAHYQVSKAERAGVTRSRIAALDEQGRVEEIARMLGGLTITETTRQHAREMLAPQEG